MQFIYEIINWVKWSNAPLCLFRDLLIWNWNNFSNNIFNYSNCCFNCQLFLPVLAFYVFWKHRHNFDSKKKFVLMEFFADLRNIKVARVNITLLLVRRVIFVCLVIFFINFPREFLYTVIIDKLYSVNLNRCRVILHYNYPDY